MEYVISAIWSALELFCFILFNGAFLVRKTRKKSDAFAIVGIWIFTSIYAHLPINQLLKQLCLPIIYAGISLLLYTGTYFAHFFLSVICYIFIAAIQGRYDSGRTAPHTQRNASVPFPGKLRPGAWGAGAVPGIQPSQRRLQRSY